MMTTIRITPLIILELLSFFYLLLVYYESLQLPKIFIYLILHQTKIHDAFAVVVPGVDALGGVAPSIATIL